MATYIVLSLCFFKIVLSMDYYAGVFNKNDFLVAQDNLYKERVPFRVTQSMYGRYFKCPITYYRVMDRLGMGRGPRVQLTRGGLRHRFLTLRITSQYNLPTSVTILVGCENKKELTTKRGPSSVPPGDSQSTAPGDCKPETSGDSKPDTSGSSTAAAPGGDASESSSGATSETTGGDASESSSGATDVSNGGDASELSVPTEQSGGGDVTNEVSTAGTS